MRMCTCDFGKKWYNIYNHAVCPPKYIQGDTALKNHSKRKAVSFTSSVAMLFAVCFAVRLVLALTLHTNTTISIDENLYPNIARSLADSFSPAYRGMDVSYPYLLYPLLLVPVFRLQRIFGGDLFRWVQVFGTALMTSCVFPAALSARDITGDRRKALICAGLAALMPDMVMGGFEMSECVIWPLAAWLMFSAWRMLDGRHIKYAYITAVLAALMFFAKPGAIVMGIIMIAAALCTRLKTKHGTIHILGAAGTLLAGVGVVYALYYGVFGASSSLAGLYDYQTADLAAKDIPLIIEAFVISMFLSVFALMGVFAVIPFANFKRMNSTNRAFFIALCAGITAINLGSAIYVVPSMYKEGAGLNIPVHLRYCAMFLPAYISCAFSTEKPVLGRRSFIALAAIAVLSVFPGARAGFSAGHGSGVDSMILDAFSPAGDFNYTLTGIIATVAVILAMVFAGLKAVKGKSFIGISAAALAALMVFNNVFAYRISIDDADEGIIGDAMQINALLNEKDGEYLGITLNNYHDGYIYWLESRLNRPLEQVAIDEVIEHMAETGGVYSPFVPKKYRPISECHKTPDADTLILGKGILASIEPAAGCAVSTTENGHFAYIRLSKGMPFCATAISGLTNTLLSANSTATLYVFDASRNVNGTLTLKIRLSGERDGAKLTISSAGESVSLELTRQSQTYEIRLPYSDTVTLKSGADRVAVRSYSTETAK